MFYYFSLCNYSFAFVLSVCSPMIHTGIFFVQILSRSYVTFVGTATLVESLIITCILIRVDLRRPLL